MGLGGILQELKAEGVLTFYHDYRSGRLYDWSGNGRNGTATNISFTKDGALFKAASSSIVVPSYTAMESATGSMLASLIYCETGSFNIISKDTGVGGDKQFNWVYSHYAPNMVIENTNGVDPYLVVAISGQKTHGISYTAGVTPKGYLNGVSIGSYVGNYSCTAKPLAVVTIGNYTNGGFNAQLGTVFKYFLHASRVLTATEHLRIYAQLENMSWDTKGLTPGPMMP
jgi:hypothetical protein